MNSSSSSGKDEEKSQSVTMSDFEIIYQSAKSKNKEVLAQFGCLDIHRGIETPISLLAKEGDISSIEFLIAQGAKLDWALEGAAIGGHEKLVTTLLAQGAKLDVAVEGAVMGGHLKDEQRTLHFLLLMSDDKLREKFANAAVKSVSFNILNVLKKANAIIQYMKKDKTLSFHQARALTVTEVQDFLSYRSSESQMLPADLAGIVTSYLTPIEQKEASQLHTKEDNRRNNERLAQEEKLEKRLRQQWEINKYEIFVRSKAEEQRRVRDTFGWSQPPPDEVREKIKKNNK